MHVFLRIKPDWDFVAVRRAGIALAREVERRAPDAVTTSWWKEERGKRMFIDYNQNARDRTFASAYSVRKHPDRHRVDAADLGRTGRRRSRRLHDRHGARNSLPGAADPWAGIDAVAHSHRFAAGDGRPPTRSAGSGTCRIRRAIRRCPASRRGCSRARRWPRTGMMMAIRQVARLWYDACSPDT